MWTNIFTLYTGYDNAQATLFGACTLQDSIVYIFLSSRRHNPSFGFSMCIRVRTKTSCCWEAPHGLPAHLVCLLSCLPIVKLNVLFWVHSCFDLVLFSSFCYKNVPLLSCLMLMVLRKPTFVFIIFSIFLFPRVDKKEMQNRYGT